MDQISGASLFDELRKEIVSTPELREQYERTRQSVTLVRRFLMEVDAERERAGITKAALARRIGVTPSAMRRMFSSPSSNPTFRTLLEMAIALGMEVSLKPARGSRRSPSSPARSPKRGKREAA